jgi:hypothetical protein
LLGSATEFPLNKSIVRESDIVVFSTSVPVGVSGGANPVMA